MAIHTALSPLAPVVFTCEPSNQWVVRTTQKTVIDLSNPPWIVDHDQDQEQAIEQQI